MSFLARSAIRQSATAHPRSVPSVTHLCTTPTRYKSVTETTKETLDTVNKKVGKGLASAIEGTESVIKKTKEAAGGITDEASKKTKETAAEASQKANQAQRKDEMERGKSY